MEFKILEHIKNYQNLYAAEFMYSKNTLHGLKIFKKQFITT